MLLIAAAAAAGPMAAQDTVRAAPRMRPSQDLITREQIAGRSFQNAYEIVDAIRSNWLVARPSLQVRPSAGMSGGQSSDTTRTGGSTGAGSSTSSSSGGAGTYTSGTYGQDRSPLGEEGGIQVYLDGTRMGGIEQLRLIPAAMVVWVRRYSSTDAHARFGPGHSAGVVFVSTRAESSP